MRNLKAVIPAKAGIHVAPMQKAKMDFRVRGNDGLKRGNNVSASHSLSPKRETAKHQNRYVTFPYQYLPLKPNGDSDEYCKPSARSSYTLLSEALVGY